MAEQADIQRAVQTAISQTLTSSMEAIRAQIKELVAAVATLGERAASGSSPESVVAAIPALMQAQAKAASVSASLEVLSRFFSLSVQMSAAPVVAVAAPAPAVAPRPVAAPVEIPAGVPAERYEPARAPAVREAPPAPAAVEEVPAAVEEPVAAPPVVEEVRAPAPAPVAAAAPVEFDLESLPPEKREMHKKAKRFARVTVQDIISYKPKEVELGREKKDLYQRFQEEIDRGRSMYEKRFAEIADSPVDYFYEELVRVLANNNPEALGKFPYPVPTVRVS